MASSAVSFQKGVGNRTNLDEYINYFDSSFLLQSEQKPPQEVNSKYTDEETSNKKNSQVQRSAGRPGQQYPSQLAALLQSPLTNYLQKAKINEVSLMKQGLSGNVSNSYQQAISVLSDCKESKSQLDLCLELNADRHLHAAAQKKKNQKTLQSPPEFTSPADLYFQQNYSLASGIHFTNPRVFGKHTVVEPQFQQSFSTLKENNPNGVASHQSLGAQHVLQFPMARATHSSQEEFEKLSFHKFYEQTATVSPHQGRGLLNLNGLHSTSDKQPKPYAQYHINSQVKPFSTSSMNNVDLRNPHMRCLSKQMTKSFLSKADSIQDQFEQISQFIDYDIKDFLPPGRQAASASSSKHCTTEPAKRSRATPNPFSKTGGGATGDQEQSREKARASQEEATSDAKCYGCTQKQASKTQWYTSRQPAGDQSHFVLSSCASGEEDETSSHEQRPKVEAAECSYYRENSKLSRKRKRRGSRGHGKYKMPSECSESNEDQTSESREEPTTEIIEAVDESEEKPQRRKHERTRSRDHNSSQFHNRSSQHQSSHNASKSSKGGNTKCKTLKSESLEVDPKTSHNSSIERMGNLSNLESTERQQLAVLILQGDKSVEIFKPPEDKLSKTSPRFYLHISQSEMNEKNQMNLLQSMVQPSDFQSLHRMPSSGRNHFTVSQPEEQSQHILVSTISPSHDNDDKTKGDETLPDHGDGSQSAEMHQLTTIVPAGQTCQSVADLSQTGIIQDIHSLESQPTADVQTSFSQLYQPYTKPPAIKQADDCTSAEMERPDLNVEYQSTFALKTSANSIIPRESLSVADMPPFQPSAKSARQRLSLTESVVVIQRAIRASLGRRKATNEDSAAQEEKTQSPQRSHMARQALEPSFVQTEPEPASLEEEEKTQGDPAMKECEPKVNQKSLVSTQEDESSEMEIPEMFEFDGWWIEAETPMADNTLAAFLKHYC